MFMKKLLALFFILTSIYSSAQKISGTVFNAKGDLLPYASVTIKGTSIGASANTKARFSFNRHDDNGAKPESWYL